MGDIKEFYSNVSATNPGRSLSSALYLQRNKVSKRIIYKVHSDEKWWQTDFNVTDLRTLQLCSLILEIHVS